MKSLLNKKKVKVKISILINHFNQLTKGFNSNKTSTSMHPLATKTLSKVSKMMLNTKT